MNSREVSMRKVEEFIEKNYKGVKKQFFPSDEQILVQNILVQFHELFWDKDDISYLENGEVDFETLKNKIESSSKEDWGLKTSLYEVILPSGKSAEVTMELITGYISLSTASSLESDIEIVNQIYRELVLCRGITQKDIDEKNMIYYHYEVAKKERDT